MVVTVLALSSHHRQSELEPNELLGNMFDGKAKSAPMGHARRISDVESAQVTYEEPSTKRYRPVSVETTMDVDDSQCNPFSEGNSVSIPNGDEVLVQVCDML